MTAVLESPTATTPITKREILLIAHGSRDPRHSLGVRGIAEAVQGISGIHTQVAYLEHNTPRAESATNPGQPVTPEPAWRRQSFVIPLLLSAGFHWHRDIPTVVGYHGDERRLLAPLPLTDFAPAVVDLALAAGAASHVVLAAAGSTNAALLERLNHLAGVLTTAIDVSIATHPHHVAEVANRDSLVVPVVVADGMFADRIRDAATSVGARTTEVLGAHPQFAAAIAAAIPGE